MAMIAKNLLGFLIFIFGIQLIPGAENFTPGSLEFFEKKIRPVLVSECYQCHSKDEKVKGGLRLDWKGGWQEEMANVTKAGFHTVLSAPFYLNYISYGADWPKYYSVEPTNFTGGDEAEAKGLVGGVEACFWSEWIDATNFIPRAWPRAAAVAERGWSTRDTRDLAEAEARLHEFRCKLIDRGLNAEPIGVCGNEGCNSKLSPVRVPGYAGSCPTEFAPIYNAPF